MRVAVLVPRRADGGQRDRVWAWARDDWWPAIRSRVAQNLGWSLDVSEGHHDGGEFNRSVAINQAYRWAHHRSDEPMGVVVIADADTIVGPQQAASAIQVAHATGQITFGHGRFAHLTREGTERIMAGWRGDWEPYVDWESLLTASSFVAVRADLWHQVGGFDEGFVGWGYEDVGFSLACQALGGGHHRIAGTAWHLFHDPSPHTGNEESPIWRANKARCDRYIDCAGDTTATLALLRTLRAEAAAA